VVTIGIELKTFSSSMLCYYGNCYIYIPQTMDIIQHNISIMNRQLT